MSDPYYDEIVRIAMTVPGVRCALQSPRSYGLSFETDDDPAQAADQLREQFLRRAWRVERQARRDNEASMYVLSEIDRGVNVFVIRAKYETTVAGAVP